MGRLPFRPSVKRARIRLGLTQRELGLKLASSVSQPTIAQWENENAVPTNEQKAEINYILGKLSNDSKANDETEEAIETPSAIG